jgi:hypothetical protein
MEQNREKELSMKKNLIKRICFVLGALAFVAVVSAQAQDTKPFIGAWKGTLSVASVELEIALNFTLDEAKKIQGTFDSITQGGFGIKLGNIEIKDKTITFIIDDPNAPGDPTFKGTLDGTGQKLSGEFSQAGMAGTFAVEKEK